MAISPARNVRPLDTAGPSDDEEGCPVLSRRYRASVRLRGGGLREPLSVVRRRSQPPPPALDCLTAQSCGRCEVVIYTAQARHVVRDSSRRSSFRAAAGDLGRPLARAVERRAARARADLRESRGGGGRDVCRIRTGRSTPSITFPRSRPPRPEAHRHHRTDEGPCLGCDVVAREKRVAAGLVNAERQLRSRASRSPPAGPTRSRCARGATACRRLGDLDPAEQLDLVRAIRDIDASLRRTVRLRVPLPDGRPGGASLHSRIGTWRSSSFPSTGAAPTTKIRASVETATGLFLNDVLPEDAARRLAELEVSAAPIDADCLFVVEAARRPHDHRPNRGLIMKALDPFEIWLVTGSQQLYGDAVLRRSTSTPGRWRLRSTRRRPSRCGSCTSR